MNYPFYVYPQMWPGSGLFPQTPAVGFKFAFWPGAFLRPQIGFPYFTGWQMTGRPDFVLRPWTTGKPASVMQSGTVEGKVRSRGGKATALKDSRWDGSIQKKSHEPPSEKEQQEQHKLRSWSFTAKDLNQRDVDILVSLYGRDIEDVYDLSAGQKWMLDQSDRAESAFFLQTMFKLEINLDPPSFRKHVDEITEKRGSLRSAFVTEGQSRPVRVVLKNRRVEMVFRDISEMDPGVLEEYLERQMEADRRRGFDLERDSLLRIACYRINGENGHAFIISQPHIDSDGMSLMLLMKDIFMPFLFGGTVPPMFATGQDTSDQEYGKWLSERDMDAELAYWKSNLAGLLPFVLLPGREKTSMAYAGRSFSLELGEELTKKLGALQGTLGASISVIMQAAWAAFLMRVRGTREITYGLVSSGREGEVANSFQLTGGFINVLPLRIRIKENAAFSALTKLVREQQTGAMTNAHCSIREIQTAIGREEPLFDHLLNFHQFYSVPDSTLPPGGGMPLEVKTYDNLSEDLCIYFVSRGRQTVCEFSYNGSAITEDAIRLLADGYRQVLEQIAEKSSDVLLDELEGPSIKDFERLDTLRARRVLRIVSDMRKLRAFEGLEDVALWDLLQECRVLSYQEDDVILQADKRPAGALFLLSGRAEYFGIDQNGWTVPLRIIREGSLISARGLWQASETKAAPRLTGRGAIAKNDEISVLDVPAEVYEELVRRYPAVAFNLMRELEEGKAVMERLWMTA